MFRANENGMMDVVRRVYEMDERRGMRVNKDVVDMSDVEVVREYVEGVNRWWRMMKKWLVKNGVSNEIVGSVMGVLEEREFERMGFEMEGVDEWS